MEKFVNFSAVRAAVSIGQVFDHYGIKFKRTGKELRGRCPIHKGDDKNSFHANTANQRFHCVSCGVHGNVIDFCAAMEKCSIREAALKLQSWFPVMRSWGRHQVNNISGQAIALAPVEAVNPPLGHTLEGLDCTHPYLKQRGITEETARHFGVGFFPGKGSMAERIAIPIHNQCGELVGYAGRAVDEQTEPKYTSVPGGFQKSALLYNLHRVKPPIRKGLVYVVESFFGVMKLVQAGFPNVVALMGSSMSETQVELLSRAFTNAILLLDEDEAGMEGTMEAVLRLSHFMYVSTGCLPQDVTAIDELSEERIRRLLAAADVVEEKDRPQLVK